MPESRWESQDLPIGEVIFIARTAQELTHEELSARTGIHRNTIRNIEKGDRPPSIPVLIKLSTGLGIELWKLFRKAETLKPAQRIVRSTC